MFYKKVLGLGLSLALVISSTSYSNAAVSTVDKIQGENRYETAAKISEKQNYTTAILVNSDKSLADGLSASGLSGAVNAPILLTQKDTIPVETSNRLKNVKKVYLVGSEGVISTKIENQLKSQGKEVERLGGSDRYQTSYKVAKEISEIKNIDKVILTNGYKGEADAMSVSPVAARDGVPIILTDGNTVPFDTKQVESYVIGGPGIMSDKLVSSTGSIRIGGTDRFDTNKKVIEKFYNNPKEFYLSKAYQLVDALTVSPLAKNAPVVLVHNGSDKSILKGATKITALGGVDEVSLYQSTQATNGVFITQNMEVHFINVGQGDATYIEMPDGTDILIDAGEGAYGKTVVNYLKAQEKDIDIEYLIATHPDSDHIGGMQQVFKDLNVKKFYYPFDAQHDTQTWNNVLSLAKSEGCVILDAKLKVGLNIGGALLRFVQPDKDYTDTNEDSVVALLDYNNTEVLLTGDAESITEADMINEGTLTDVDVLKVGHHGSNSSTTQAFLNKVKPEHSIISVGQNSYGHPTSTILNRLIGIGSKVWRTDKNGTIILTSDGYTYNIKANGNPQTTPVPDNSGSTNNGGNTNTDNSQIVYANGGSSSSNKYHKTATAHNMKGAIKMTKSEAEKKGYVACKTCF